jgi:hypothetical protein
MGNYTIELIHELSGTDLNIIMCGEAENDQVQLVKGFFFS